jgi:Rad3-related DNA helicase
MAHCKNSHRFVYPRGKNRQIILDKFYRSKNKELVLLSPSLMEGLDLKGDLSSFSIIVKIPYASLADKWVKAKMNYTKDWYGANTVQKLLQSCGRHIRSADEIGVTYILDSNFSTLYNMNRKMFPKWWIKLLKR